MKIDFTSKIKDNRKFLSLKFLTAFIMIILSLNFAAANFSLGNKSYEIQTSYSPGQSVKGWINISFNNEDGSSLLTGFSDDIMLLDFLSENEIDCDSSSMCSCFPQNCEPDYSASNGIIEKSFALNPYSSKLVGIKLMGNINSVDKLSFSVSTSTEDSCLSPLKIDVLNNEISDWQAKEAVNNSECSMDNSYGCYNDADSTGESVISSTTLYCGKINLASAKGYKLGADVTGTGNAKFKFSVSAHEAKNCEVVISSGGEIGCFIQFNNELEEPIQADVCIIADASNSNDYSIKYEDNNPCGYSGGFNHDFKIFAKPLKYKGISSFVFNQSTVSNSINIGDEIENYILNKYDGNCSSGCIIPIKFLGINQNIVLSNLRLEYVSDGLSRTDNKIYDINSSDFKINSKFLKLNLDGLFKIPSSAGDKNFVLKLGGENVFSKSINVGNGTSIADIVPKEFPALVPVTFVALGPENKSYSWNFGDGTKETTTSNKIVHTYMDIGTYELSASLLGENISSKVVDVKAISPKSSINQTISDYKKDLDNVENNISKLDVRIKDYLTEKIDLDGLRGSINEQEKRNSEYIDDTTAVNIMTKLLKLNIPYKIGIGQIIQQSVFFPNENRLDFDVLEELGAGNIGGERSEYETSISNWAINNLEMKIESKTYSVFFRDENSEDLVSYVKVKIIPKTEIKNLYFVVAGDKMLNSEFEEVNNGFAKEYSDVNSEISVEFLYPGKISILDIPVYVSPKISEISVSPNIEVCDNDGVCDEGENYKNCRADCKPLGIAWVLWIVLFFIAFIIYIILQEWYKRHYETHLFPNKSQLFNLINFISNSLNQGYKKPNVFEKLKDVGWSSEQVNYSWKKFHGERTGMWEIPIFKWVENREVKRELERRKGININFNRGV